MERAHRPTLAVWISIIAAVVLAVLATQLPSQQRSVQAQTTEPATLSGEFLFTGDVTVSNVQCNPQGTSSFTMHVEGTAIGPYPGTFEETLTVKFGPQEEGNNPLTFHFGDTEITPDAGTPTEVTANFRIDSPITGTEITGTKKLTSEEIFEGQDSLYAMCGTFVVEDEQSVEIVSFAATTEYDATIRNTLTNETFQDNGLSDIEADYTEMNGEPGPIVGFEEGFVSAPTFPETKEECQEGGFETFGFTNQGDCVSFVETMNNPGNLNELGQNVPTSQEQ